MIRRCCGEHPRVFEVTAESQAELWEQVAELARDADEDGNLLTVGSTYIRESGTWEAVVFVS